MSKLTPTGLAAAAATILGAGALLMAPQFAPGSESSHSLPLQLGLGAAVVVTTLVGARLTWGRVRAPLALEGWPEDRAAWARKLGAALAACLVISFVAKQFVAVDDQHASVVLNNSHRVWFNIQYFIQSGSAKGFSHPLFRVTFNYGPTPPAQDSGFQLHKINTANAVYEFGKSHLDFILHGHQRHIRT